jgi:hypothetical protein
MLDLQQLLSFYPERLHPFRTNILRECLPFKILESLGSSPLAAPLVFMGGTCIHLVHGNPRFSEDLNFDNRGLSAGDFDQLSQSVAGDLAAEGHSVELKSSQSGSFRAFLRFTNILQESGLTGHREEKLDIESEEELNRRLLARCEDLDFRQLARDIEPFIFNLDDTKKVLLFREFVETL